jgi:hypothetical protein
MKVTSRLVVIHDIEVIPGVVIQEAEIIGELVTSEPWTQYRRGGHPAKAEETPRDPRCQCNFGTLACPVHGQPASDAREQERQERDELVKRLKRFVADEDDVPSLFELFVGSESRETCCRCNFGAFACPIHINDFLKKWSEGLSTGGKAGG